MWHVFDDSFDGVMFCAGYVPPPWGAPPPGAYPGGPPPHYGKRMLPFKQPCCLICFAMVVEMVVFSSVASFRSSLHYAWVLTCVYVTLLEAQRQHCLECQC